jgi:hypothetical protein
MFLNTLIRRSEIKYVTAKWPVLGVEAVFIGERWLMAGENFLVADYFNT